MVLEKRDAIGLLSEDDDNKPFLADARNKSDEASISIGKIRILKPHNRKKFRFPYCLSILMILSIGVYAWIRLIPKNKSINSRCDHFSVSNVWDKQFPMLKVESALRLIDANNDSVLDVIIPFGTGAEVLFYQSIICQMFFNLTKEQSKQGCGGGIMAIDGKNGNILWRTYTKYPLLSLNCDIDLTRDGIQDCITGGKMASLLAIDGSNGEILWSYRHLHKDPILSLANFYTPMFLSDFDDDNLPDILVMHGGKNLSLLSSSSLFTSSSNIARLIIASSKTGSIISWSKVPDNSDSYYNPQKLIQSDGEEFLLFGTGSETQSGSLYVISFDDLFHGNMDKALSIYTDCCKGIIAPPVLIDLNNDSVSDIVISLFNSTVMAFDGQNFKMLWKYHFFNSESYSSPTVGYFNDDQIPDIFVMYSNGPGSPIYYKTQANILDGRTGRPLLNESIEMLLGTKSSPLTISIYGANDGFIFWYSSCENVNLSKSMRPFKLYSEKSDTISQSDFCSLRFNKSSYNQLIAITKSSKTVLYDSRKDDLSHLFIDYNELNRIYLDNDNQEHQQETQQPYQYDFDRSHSDDNDYNKDIQNVRDVLDLRYYSNKRSLSSSILKNPIIQGNEIQHVTSTGTLAPSIDGSIDIIFATYWLPAANVKIMPKTLEDCINQYIAFENNDFVNKRKDEYVTMIEQTCATVLGIEKSANNDDDEDDNNNDNNNSENNNININHNTNNNNLRMGWMSLHRKTISCHNTYIKPYHQQIWPSYMGIHGNCLINIPQSSY